VTFHDSQGKNNQTQMTRYEISTAARIHLWRLLDNGTVGSSRLRRRCTANSYTVAAMAIAVRIQHFVDDGHRPREISRASSAKASIVQTQIKAMRPIIDGNGTAST